MVLWEFYTREIKTCSCKEIVTQVFITTLFTVDKNRKQFKYLSMDE